MCVKYRQPVKVMCGRVAISTKLYWKISTEHLDFLNGPLRQLTVICIWYAVLNATKLTRQFSVHTRTKTWRPQRAVSLICWCCSLTYWQEHCAFRCAKIEFFGYTSRVTRRRYPPVESRYLWSQRHKAVASSALIRTKIWYFWTGYCLWRHT